MKRIIVRIILLCSMFLAACGNKNAEQTESSIGKCDWTRGFTAAEKPDEQFYSAIAYQDMPHEAVKDVISEGRIRLTVTKNNCFYTLRTCYTKSGPVVLLEKFMPVESSLDAMTVDCTKWEVDNSDIRGFDICGEGEKQQYVFIMGTDTIKDEEGIAVPTKICIIYTDQNLVMTSKTDIPQESEITSFNIFVDGDGYVYIISEDGYSIQIFDNKGTLVTEYNFPQEEQQLVPIGNPVKTEDERVIIPVVEKGSDYTKLLWLNEEHQLSELASIEGDISRVCYAMKEDFFYYMSENAIIRWDVNSGKCSQIMKQEDAGASSRDRISLIIHDNNSIMLRILTKTEDWVVTFSTDAVEQKETVRLANISAENKLLNNCAANFTRKNPLYPVMVEMADEGEEENYHDKIFMEMIDGKGPDMLYVSYEDMKILADKGILADLSDYISMETKEQIIPGVLELGTINGVFSGIAPNICVNTLLTVNDTWNEDTWKFDNILNLLEQKPEIQELISYQNGAMHPSIVLYNMIAQDMAHSPYIDWEAKQSRFEEKDFMKVLQLVQKYANGIDNGMLGEKKVVQGISMAFWSPVTEAYVVYSYISMLGDAGHVVGWPSLTGKGSYIQTEGILVVNGQAGNKEAVSAYLEYLLGTESQAKISGSLSVRLDITDTTVKYREETGEYFWHTVDGNTILDKKKDGTTYNEEYKDFLRNCTPCYPNEEVYSIIEEESDRYFNGDVDALTAVRMIDNRVQLYLNEKD
ncbi:MAG TPA: extracellular solute-binding protein [Lachnospiraceae bacterium]|nr:extracellular solute-binding protein [Lachnospiraceae bacterium]